MEEPAPRGLWELKELAGTRDSNFYLGLSWVLCDPKQVPFLLWALAAHPVK